MSLPRACESGRGDGTLRLLFLMMAIALGAAGLGLVGSGVAIAVGSDAGPGCFAVALGLLVLYGAYLFGRAARRTHRALISQPPTPEQSRERRRTARGGVVLTVASAVSALVMPIPTAVRVIGAVIALLVLPVYLAFEFEPRKRGR